MKKKRRKMARGLWIAPVVFLALGSLATLWADYMDYNRPNPLMDYVPQEIGIYDTMYWELDESHCRSCHGNNVADRHHLTFNECTLCHESFEPPISDCLTGGCHSWDDVDTNGWHHNMDLSASDVCIACHDPNLVEEITPFRNFESSPPSIVTPTPFSCENCHWQQDYVPGEDCHNPGHPSTYHHYDAWANPTGFYEYMIPIYGNSYTHHMGEKGNVANECSQCHALDPDYPDWDPYNPELIRTCETCHSVSTLHNIAPHVSDTNGWEAIGFHVPYSNTQTRDVDPIFYRTWDPTDPPCAPETPPGFTASEMCLGCHGDNIPDPPEPDDCDGNIPVINTTVEGIQPRYGSCGVVVTLRGQHFGEERLPGRTVQIRRRQGGSWTGNWTNVPIISWTNTLIEFYIPCSNLTFPAGNYRVKVETECGESNRVNYGLKDSISVTSISPNNGPCNQWIRIWGDSFGNAQSQMFSDGFNGVHRVVDIVSSAGTYTAIRYKDWTSTTFKVRFSDVFEGGDDPYTGNRNFVQDDGSDACPAEPTMLSCVGLDLGDWSVYVKAIYFGDNDASGGLSCGDTIFQVTVSNPMSFELTNAPYINKLLPNKIELKQVMSIFGINFGPSQTNGKVYMGTLDQYNNDTGRLEPRIRMWSSTKIKFRVKGPPGWQGKTKYVWMTKDGRKSNYREVQILAPLP
jgi:hypothetical protein